MAEVNVKAPANDASPDGAKAPPYPSAKVAYTSLFVLTVVVMFTVLDRQILALLIDPIKKDFRITDTEAALLLGLAFSISYAIAGFPIARAADRWNRRNMIAASLAVWSAATALSGLAQNYVQLFVARLAVGAGESGYGPATWSLVTDLFPREKVAFGTGILAIGATVGTGLALFLGGAVLGFVEHLPPVTLPLIGTIRSWQWALMIVGLPGLIWAAIVMMTHEPMRRGIGDAKKLVPVSDVIKYLASEWRSYTATIGGVAMKYLVVLGFNQWIPTLFHREFGWTLSKIGLIQGTIAIVAAPIGMICGAKLSERWIKQGKLNANLTIALICLLVMVPISIITPLLPTPELMLSVLPISYFFFSLGVGPNVAAFQLMTPSNIRSQIGSLSQFGSNVIAFAFAPLIIALFTDYVFKDPMMLKYSMTCSAIILGPLAIFTVWQGLKPYTLTMERIAKEQPV